MVSIASFKAAAFLWERGHVWYTLTNRRAVIVTSRFLRGKETEQYRLTPDLPLIIDNTDSPPSVIFATKRVWKGSSGSGNHGRSAGVSVGFKRIENAERIYQMMKHYTAT